MALDIQSVRDLINSSLTEHGLSAVETDGVFKSLDMNFKNFKILDMDAEIRLTYTAIDVKFLIDINSSWYLLEFIDRHYTESFSFAVKNDVVPIDSIQARLNQQIKTMVTRNKVYEEIESQLCKLEKLANEHSIRLNFEFC